LRLTKKERQEERKKKADRKKEFSTRQTKCPERGAVGFFRRKGEDVILSNGTNWREREILCPFYRQLDPQLRRISCEGVTDRNTTAQLYKDNLSFNSQLEAFCSGEFSRCEVYRMLLYYKYFGDAG